jgi:hypothetical protein
MYWLELDLEYPKAHQTSRMYDYTYADNEGFVPLHLQLLVTFFFQEQREQANEDGVSCALAPCC